MTLKYKIIMLVIKKCKYSELEWKGQIPLVPVAVIWDHYKSISRSISGSFPTPYTMVGL